jgi:hypothetical protein
VIQGDPGAVQGEHREKVSLFSGVPGDPSDPAFGAYFFIRALGQGQTEMLQGSKYSNPFVAFSNPPGSPGSPGSALKNNNKKQSVTWIIPGSPWIGSAHAGRGVAVTAPQRALDDPAHQARADDDRHHRAAPPGGGFGTEGRPLPRTTPGVIRRFFSSERYKKFRTF